MTLSILGATKLGEGYTACVYALNGRAIKVYHSMPLEYVQKEAAAQSFAYNNGLSVPQVFEVYTLEDGRAAIEMEALQADVLFERRMPAESRNQALQAFIELQVRTHLVSGEDVLKDGLDAGGALLKLDTMVARMGWRISHHPYLTESQKEWLLGEINHLATKQMEGLKTLRLCHGDYHPHNVMLSRDASAAPRLWIIDWLDATAGIPAADACRTYLIFQQFIKRSANKYLKGYCQRAKDMGLECVTEADILAWMPVIAAIRATEGVDDGERERLLSLIPY